MQGLTPGQMDWLDLEVLQPNVGEQSAGLRELLATVESIRHELGKSTTNPGHVPTEEQIRHVTNAAARILDSPESFRLPRQTVDAVDWLRKNLLITK